MNWIKDQVISTIKWTQVSNFEPKRYIGAYRNMGVSGVSLRVSGRENSVDKNEGADDLSRQSGALAVPRGQGISSTTILVVQGLLEGLHQPYTTDSTQTLCYYVEHSPEERHLACQEESESHSWVDVSSCNCHKYFIDQSLDRKRSPSLKTSLANNVLGS